MASTYTLYIYDISYFSGKMQGYLRYKGVPHRVQEAQWRDLALNVVEEAGVMEVPLLRTPEGELWRDTTAMIEALEGRFSTGAVLPEDPALAFVMRLIEDYADEGLWRPALYYRWADDRDANLYAGRFLDEFLRFPDLGGRLRGLQKRYIIARQRRVYMRGEGITEANRQAVEQHYRDELADLEALLETRPFLLGQRPCLVDFGYFASMFRHFSIDPTPSRIMRDATPRVYAWVARLWNARADSIGAAPLLDFQTVSHSPVVQNILRRIGRLYLPYLLANARAVHAGTPRFTVELDGHRYPDMPAIPFRAWSRRRLIRHHQALAGADQARVDALLGPAGCLEALLMDPDLDPRHPPGDHLPACIPRKLRRRHKLRLLLTGTPHHEDAR